MGESDHSRQTERVALAADRIRIDAATAEVVRAFVAAGVDCLLLKGPALSGWLYEPEEPRSYSDSDLWVRPGQAEPAEQALSGLGFVKHVDEGGMPDWWQEHGSDWTRELDGVVVDLHRTLAGLGVTPERAWQILSARTETLTVAGYPVRILSVPARAMHVAVHAAHHGEASYKATIHLERALARVDPAVWPVAASLAAELEATDAFAAGLRLLPAGAALAERLVLPPTQLVKVALHAASPPPVALGFEQLASAHGIRARLDILLRKLVPPPGFIRHWWPPAARNRRMLIVGYLYRPVWLLRNAPRGMGAWREARRRVREGR